MAFCIYQIRHKRLTNLLIAQKNPIIEEWCKYQWKRHCTVKISFSVSLDSSFLVKLNYLSQKYHASFEDTYNLWVEPSKPNCLDWQCNLPHRSVKLKKWKYTTDNYFHRRRAVEKAITQNTLSKIHFAETLM